jgi:hypothetical protein
MPKPTMRAIKTPMLKVIDINIRRYDTVLFRVNTRVLITLSSRLGGADLLKNQEI